VRSLVAKSAPWTFAVPIKSWLAVALDTLVWAIAAIALYIVIFYAAMWVM
jgi:hypothetical protein